MKKIILLFILHFTFLVNAQFSNPINWSGIITNNTGTPLVNSNVALKFEIVKGAVQSLQYSELHTTTTDENGFINAVIGSGTVTFGNYQSIDWSATDLNFIIEADTGSGFVAISSSSFKAVPYANKALSANLLQFANNYIVITQDGSNEIDFVTNNVSRATIDNMGVFQVNNLIGTNTEDVVVNASGELQRKGLQTKYLSIPTAAFVNSGFTYNNMDGYYNSSGTASPIQYVVPIHLPNGVSIRQFKAYFLDNVTQNFSVDLYYYTDNGVSSTAVYQMFSGSTQPSATWQNHLSGAGTINHIVDNLNNSYYLILYSSSWPNGSNKLGLKRIVLTYEE